jgi:hypothetical protein
LFWLVAQQENDHGKALSAYNCHQVLWLPFNNYNQQTPKNNLTSKLKPKNKPCQESVGKDTTTIN